MKALLIVDIQNDCCPGGSLAIEQGDEVIPIVNRSRKWFPVTIFSQDWHPHNHESFASNHPGKKPGDVILVDGIEQALWPDHCVQGTTGAEFHRELDFFSGDPVFRKGTDPKVDSYSTFYDNARRKDTGLAAFLNELSVRDLFIGGLATDYCVQFSVLDALSEGFRVTVIEDACRGVNLKPGDADRALHNMWSHGARIVKTLPTTFW